MLISDPQDTAVLRSIRRRFQDGSAGNWWYGFIPIKRTEEAPRYDFSLHLRDAIPYEDTSGVIPIRW